MGAPLDDSTAWESTWMVGPSTEGSLSSRRPSEGRLPMVQTSAPRTSQTQSPALPPRQTGQPMYQPSQSQYLPDFAYSHRRPSGFPNTPYAETSHAQERLHDPRLQQATGRSPAPGQRGQTSNTPRSESQRIRHPFSYAAHELSNEHLQTPALSTTRSVDNLRMTSGPLGMTSHQSQVYGPLRTSITPAPGFAEHRNIQPAAASATSYRSPSSDRARDGRYPESLHSSSRGVATMAPTAIDTGLVPFPSPHPNSATSSASWRSHPQQFNSLPRSARGPTFDITRPNTVHYDRSPPPPTSPETTIPPRRPSTYYDDVHVPDTARTVIEDVATVRRPSSPFPWGGRARSGSTSTPYRTESPVPVEQPRISEASVFDDTESQLPYAHNTSPRSSWLSVSRAGAGRSDSDTLSVAGTVSSEATVRPGKGMGEDNDTNSGDTAKAGQWDRHLQEMIAKMGPGNEEGTLRPRKEEEEDEATLFITPPVRASETTLSGTSAIRPSPSKPNLIVNTAALSQQAYHQLNPVLSASTPSDSATESEGTGEGDGEIEGSNLKRGKSFAHPRDPNQWNFRPEPEQLYENLDRVFPQIDLDRPIVQGAESTPSTPGMESPSRVEIIGGLPLPAGAAPGRQGGPQAGSGPLGRAPQAAGPPSAPAGGFNRSKFNKAENRRSIRVVADHKRRTLQRQISRHENLPPEYDIGAEEVNSVMDDRVVNPRSEEQRKKENRRSSSMWDHKLVEVTRFARAQANREADIPESPASDGKPGTVNWVKGELIGKGSYGRVYIALNVTTGDMMAVKQVELPATEIERHDSRQQGMIKALRDEIELLKGLEHKNIVAYLGGSFCFSFDVEFPCH